MNTASILIAIALATAFLGAVVYLARHKNGGGCCGDCSRCSACTRSRSDPRHPQKP